MERLEPLAGVHEYPSRVKCATLAWHALIAAWTEGRRRAVNDASHTAWTPDGETAVKPTEDAIIAAIAEVYDPEIPVNIYELGLIYAIEIADATR